MIAQAVPTFPPGTHVSSVSIIEDEDGGYTVIAKVRGPAKPKRGRPTKATTTPRRQSRRGPADMARAEAALSFIQTNGGEANGRELAEKMQWTHAQLSTVMGILRKKEQVRLAGKDPASRSNRYVVMVEPSANGSHA
jgi:predicted ArsR family transcriptional regulator